MKRNDVMYENLIVEEGRGVACARDVCKHSGGISTAQTRNAFNKLDLANFHALARALKLYHTQLIHLFQRYDIPTRLAMTMMIVLSYKSCPKCFGCV